MNKIKFITITLFFIILFVPIVFINLSKNQISEIDNAKLPEVESINSINSLEKYIEMRVGFRDKLINVYTVLNDRLFGKMIHPTYTYGKNKFVFFKLKTEYLDKDYLNQYATMVKNMQDYVTNRGSYFVYILNPAKVSVYSDYLPNGYHWNNLREKYLKEKFDELGINYLYNERFLKLVSIKTMTFNKKYDAGHWNEYGAFYGINNLYNKIKNDGINISTLQLNDYNIKNVLQKSLPVSEFEINEVVPKLELKEKNYEINNLYGFYTDTKYKYLAASSNPNKEKSVLLFRGSYFSEKEKFVASNFNKVTFVHNYYNAINFDYFYELSDFPNIVIFDGVEYSINNQYYPISMMNNKIYNPIYSDVKDLNELEFTKINNIKSKVVKVNNSSLSYINIEFFDKNVKYAYLVIKDKIFDFSNQNNNFCLTLEDKYFNSNNAKIVLVDNEVNNKYTIDFIK